jgi:hypothetical protein
LVSSQEGFEKTEDHQKVSDFRTGLIHGKTFEIDSWRRERFKEKNP